MFFFKEKICIYLYCGYRMIYFLVFFFKRTQKRAIGIKRQVLHGIGVALERALKLARLVIPQLHFF